MAETATIRVPVETRDRLARLAQQRGTSVAKLIAEFASHEHIHQIYAEERRTWAAVLGDQKLAAELELWDETADDGID